VLVLVLGGIYEFTVETASVLWYIYQVPYRFIPAFKKYCYYLNNLWGFSVGITDGIYEYAIETGSGGMTYIPSLMKTGSGIQVILRLLPQ
jgi:hypothetical protein